jgi:hypothetical protein
VATGAARAWTNRHRGDERRARHGVHLLGGKARPLRRDVTATWICNPLILPGNYRDGRISNPSFSRGRYRTLKSRDELERRASARQRRHRLVIPVALQRWPESPVSRRHPREPRGAQCGDNNATIMLVHGRSGGGGAPPRGVARRASSRRHLACSGVPRLKPNCSHFWSCAIHGFSE